MVYVEHRWCTVEPVTTCRHSDIVTCVHTLFNQETSINFNQDTSFFFYQDTLSRSHISGVPLYCKSLYSTNFTQLCANSTLG